MADDAVPRDCASRVTTDARQIIHEAGASRETADMAQVIPAGLSADFLLCSTATKPGDCPNIVASFLPPLPPGVMASSSKVRNRCHALTSTHEHACSASGQGTAAPATRRQLQGRGAQPRRRRTEGASR